MKRITKLCQPPLDNWNDWSRADRSYSGQRAGSRKAYFVLLQVHCFLNGIFCCQDGGTLNGVGQWGGSASYSNYTLSSNSTYRLRLINAGTFAAVRFSVDNHIITVVEADGTPVEPYDVSGLVIDVAQRYSVLLRTNQTSGAYWMRSTIQQGSFTVGVASVYNASPHQLTASNDSMTSRDSMGTYWVLFDMESVIM